MYKQIVAAEAMDVVINMYSFDIFDTVITRKTKKPSEIFELMQEKMQTDKNYSWLSPRVRNNFALLRVAAEKNAVDFYSEKRQITLKNIYEIFSSMTGIPDEYIDDLIQLELSTEKLSVVPIKENIDLIMEYRNSGERVIFISDMYLSEKEIRFLLQDLHYVFNDIKIYVSADCNCLKSTGELFTYVKNKEKLTYEKWIHIGDNYFSDYLIPRQLGITTKLYKNKIPKDAYLVQINDNEVSRKAYTAITNIYKDYYGPKLVGLFAGILLYDYIEWIIEMAILRHLTKLCFIARDGYILKKIADNIISTEKIDIETEYVYSSRISWRCVDDEAINNLKGYMLEIIDRPQKEIGFVDLQASGKSFDNMERICSYDMHYFCFVMLENGTRGRKNWWVYSKRGSYEAKVELLCRALHGATIGYKEDGNKFVPVIDKFSISTEQQQTYQTYINAVCDVTKCLESMAVNQHEKLDFYSYKEELLQKIFESPSEDISDFIGEINHDNTNDDNTKYAPKMNRYQLLNCLDGKEDYKGVNIDYSILRASKADREYISQKLDERKKIYTEYLVKEATSKSKKIIIYGAGKKGTRDFNILMNRADIQIVAWVDVDWENKIKAGLPVISLKEALKKNYDYMYISIVSDMDIIKNYLAECGADKDKMIFSLNGVI